MLQDRTRPDLPANGRVRTGPCYTGKASGLITSAIALLLLVILIMLQSNPLQAGDEDLNPSIYQIFDPVTGFTIEVEQPPDDQQPASPQTHAATQTSQDPPATTSVVPAPDNSAVVAQQSTPLNPVLVAAGIFLLILIGTFAFKVRKAQHTSR